MSQGYSYNYAAQGYNPAAAAAAYYATQGYTYTPTAATTTGSTPAQASFPYGTTASGAYQTPGVAAAAAAKAAAASTPQTPQTYSYSPYTTNVAPRAPAATATSVPSAGLSSYQTSTPSNATRAAPQRSSGGTSYSHYDAAVYAAATSYLHSKATGQSSNWLGAKKSSTTGRPSGGETTVTTTGGGALSGPSQTRSSSGSFGTSSGGGRGSFPYQTKRQNYRGGAHHATHNNSQLHYCEICKISCAGAMVYKSHLEGQKHKKREAAVKAGGSVQALPKSKTTYRCDLCDITCAGHDSFQAHVKGIKHQKAFRLHQTLGKSVANADTPTVIQPTGSGGSTEVQKVVGVQKIQFVGAGEFRMLPGDKPVDPVGEDYIENVRDEHNRIVYSCKLCSCTFNDNIAKEMHCKGRRHRLAYKQKVDPSLEVPDLPTRGGRFRGSFRGGRGGRGAFRNQSVMAMNYHQQMMAMSGGMPPPVSLLSKMAERAGPGMMAKFAQQLAYRQDTFNERHIMAKHEEIYPQEDHLTAVQRIVTNTEKALKSISDKFSKEEEEKLAASGVKKDEATEAKEGTDEKKKTEQERVLKGVMRVGPLAKGLLLKSDLTIQVVVLCGAKPTRTLLSRIAEYLPKSFEELECPEKYTVQENPTEGIIYINATSEPKIRLAVILTSVLFREDGSPGEGGESGAEAATAAATITKSEQPPDVLNKQKCLEALAALRHAKWFQARCSSLQSGLVLMRVLRDLCLRVPTWAPLNNWALELLVEKVLNSSNSNTPLTPSEGFRKIFEAVSSGILLANGPGLQDPCEKETIDAVGAMSPQQREDITASAQHALRLLAFGQIYKVLSIDKLTLEDESAARKRPLASDEQSGDGKKDKKDVEMVDVEQKQA